MVAESRGLLAVLSVGRSMARGVACTAEPEKGLGGCDRAYVLNWGGGGKGKVKARQKGWYCNGKTSELTSAL